MERLVRSAAQRRWCGGYGGDLVGLRQAGAREEGGGGGAGAGGGAGGGGAGGVAGPLVLLI